MIVKCTIAQEAAEQYRSIGVRRSNEVHYEFTNDGILVTYRTGEEEVSFTMRIEDYQDVLEKIGRNLFLSDLQLRNKGEDIVSERQVECIKRYGKAEVLKQVKSLYSIECITIMEGPSEFAREKKWKIAVLYTYDFIKEAC